MTWADYEDDGAFVDAEPLRCEADHPERGVCGLQLRSWGGRALYEGDDDFGVCPGAVWHTTPN